MSYTAQPGLAEPGMFSPGLLDADVTTENKSSTDVVSGAETQSLVVNISSSDTASGADTGSVNADANPSSSDTVTSVEAQTIRVSGTDTGSGTETQSIVYTISSSDDVSGTDTQSVSAPVVQVGTATTDTAANGTSVTANKPTGITSGMLLLACMTTNDQAVTAPTGWTEFQNDKGTNAFRNRLFYKVAGGSEPASYTFSVSAAAPLVLSITGWANADPTNPIGSSNHVQTGSGPDTEPHTTPNLTTNNATNGRVMYTRACRLSGSTPITFTASGVTELVDVGVFSGGTVSYSHGWWCDNSDFTGNGATKNGLDTTASGTETDNVSATFVVRGVTQNAFIESEDSGTGTDSENIPNATLTHTETVSGAESHSIATALPTQADTGSGTESHSIQVILSSTDTASGTDTASIGIRGTDTGSGADTGSAFDQTAPTSSDTVSSVESHSIAVTLSSSDTVFGADFADSPDDQPVELGDFQVTLVMGPATIYVADYGTLEPTTTDALPGTWVDLGGTLEGVSLKVVQEFEEKTVTQNVDNPASRLKKRDLSVETNLAEPGLQNLLFALNQGAINTGAGYRSYEPPMIDRATPLTYRTVIIDGWAPGFNPDNRHKRRRIVLRKALAVDETTINYSKDKQTAQTISWSVHNVSGSTPFKIIDED